ncbi:TonB-linked SusC/RagA family outer membrane protein [Balneicella halophila]|uniref:TonB-linked SusC/RagA family outer membrane protein n=1 Tax=Balneicella halophila TaxID=1537566 RepID=A0A7L4US05_BALHA|nr:SusC/RagA family TonB-linked outer membrane protein [Balneicella halophila]PVX52558.1 TonB-linked SusC/RagA family outer membrane protein [Balneicella halophila]
MKKLMFLLVFLALGISSAWAQKTFSGKVIGPDGLGLPGVSVVEKANPINGVATDIDGNWTLTVPGDNTILEFTAIGMKPVELAASEAATVNMVADAQVLDEVMVVAYGTAKKSTFTGSAVQVDNEKLEKTQASDAAKALEGVVPGLTVTNSTGRPGSSSTLRIRGIGSLNASSAPLIILDGAPYSGQLNSINTQDIENISVLKDAASAALYGARGANGVILITTKKGKEGRVQVTFDARLGQNQRGVPEYDIMEDPGVYYTTYWEALKNSQIYGEGGSDNPAQWASDNLIPELGYNIYNVADNQVVDVNGNLTTSPIRYADGSDFNDWIDVLYDPELRQEYNLGITKGTEDNKIYFSLGYLDDKGFNLNSGFERISTRIAYETQIYEWLKVNASSQYAQTESTYPSDEENNFSNTFMWTRSIAPIYPVYKHDADGNILTDENGKKLYDDSLDRKYAGGFNLIGQQEMNELLTKDNYLTNNLRVDIDLPAGFKFSTTATQYINWWKYSDFKNPLIGDGAAYGGILYKENNSYETFNFNQILTWEKEFDLFDLNAMLGHETYQAEGEYVYGEKRSLLDPELTEFQSAATISSLGSYTTDYKVEGYFGQITADIDDKYYFSASLRRDGSSVFHPDNRWGTFWSLGASWRLNEEEFLRDTEWINSLKLRVSYGAQGNDYLYLPGSSSARAYTPYTNLYSISSDGTQSIYGPTYKGNKDITWEKNKNFNVGLEFNIFDGALAGELDFFQRKTDDMLFNLPIPSTTGFSTEPVNIGNMKNTGFEFNLTSRVYSNDDININVGVNGIHYENEVLNLPDEFKEEGIATGNRIIKEGGGVYDLWMVKYAGVDPENGDALYYIFDEDTNDFVAKPSSEHSTDKVNKQLIGSSIPDLDGGFFANGSFYGVDLGLQFSYRIGGKVYDGLYAGLMSAGDAGNNWHTDILNRWTPENTTTDVPRVQTNSQKLISSSDRFITDATYLSLRNVTLGYTLPTATVENIGLKALRVYVAADNVYLWSKRKGFDPRLTLSGSQSYSKNSAIRTISLGVKVTL